MIEVLQERILRHQEYYNKRPSKLAVTREQRAALLEVPCVYYIFENPIDASEEEKFMGIPLEVVDVI